MLQYGEFGWWSLTGVKVCLTSSSPNTVHTFCWGQVGRIKVKRLNLTQRWKFVSKKAKCHESKTSTSSLNVPVYVTLVTVIGIAEYTPLDKSWCNSWLCGSGTLCKRPCLAWPVSLQWSHPLQEIYKKNGSVSSLWYYNAISCFQVRPVTVIIFVKDSFTHLPCCRPSNDRLASTQLGPSICPRSTSNLDMMCYNKHTRYTRTNHPVGKAQVRVIYKLYKKIMLNCVFWKTFFSRQLWQVLWVLRTSYYRT